MLGTFAHTQHWKLFIDHKYNLIDPSRKRVACDTSVCVLCDFAWSSKVIILHAHDSPVSRETADNAHSGVWAAEISSIFDSLSTKKCAKNCNHDKRNSEIATRRDMNFILRLKTCLYQCFSTPQSEAREWLAKRIKSPKFSYRTILFSNSLHCSRCVLPQIFNLFLCIFIFTTVFRSQRHEIGDSPFGVRQCVCERSQRSTRYTDIAMRFSGNVRAQACRWFSQQISSLLLFGVVGICKIYESVRNVSDLSSLPL